MILGKDHRRGRVIQGLGTMASDTWSLLATVTVPLIVAVIVYALNEGAKRRDFEREKKYDQKRERYAETLSSVRRIHEIRVATEAVRAFDDVINKAGPETKGALEDVRDIIAWSTALYVREMVDARISSLIPEGKNPKGLEESVVAIIQMERDFEKALSMLTLLNAPAPILFQLRTLFDESMSMADFSDEKEERFERDLKKLEDSMKDDLQRTIGS